MRFDCEIANATLLEPKGRYRGTIAISGERVAGILEEPSGNAARTIDAEGLVALPGMVDQHVHFMDPGDNAREDFIRGSSAAAVGGVTTVVEHTHSNPVLTAEDLREKREYLKDRSVIDFGLMAHVFPDTIKHVPDLWEDGVAIFKAFTCTTHGVPGLLPDDLLRLFRSLFEAGARGLVHCEDEFITEDNEERLHAALRKDYGVIPEWRSTEAELVAVNTVALLARLTGANITVAHASQPEVIDLVRRERELGATLSIESCPQYFYIDSDEVRERGPTRKFTPPARDALAGELMWKRLARGQIDLISTDHAPSTLDQKFASDIWGCPFGLPGVETTLTMLLDAVAEGRLTLQRLVQTYSEAPARLLGLYPRKGALRIGSDADVVLVDTEQEHVLSNNNIVSKAGWTPFDGRRVKGRPVMTMLRGQVVAENGEVAAEPGGGRFVIRR
ncbi:MAG: dihydroorotase family protein [Actinomycetota bacterium]|nr:dihydroorotase family protein [Actinomycetota bacterium]